LPRSGSDGDPRAGERRLAYDLVGDVIGLLLEGVVDRADLELRLEEMQQPRTGSAGLGYK
jgi:hypothetical protein